MTPNAYRSLAATEDSHWYFRHRRRLVADQLERLSGGDRQRALDIGCGVGGTVRFLADHYREVVGVDSSPLALEIARQKSPKAHFVQGDANRIEHLFVPESFDLITLFTVLYHQWIDADASVVAQAYALLKPGGRLMVIEPAFPSLSRLQDRVSYGKKRYRLGEMEAMLKAAGFSLRTSTYYNSIALPPLALVALADRLQPAGRQEPSLEQASCEDLKTPSEWLNKAILGLLGVERLIIRKAGRFPLGISIFCLAQKQP